MNRLTSVCAATFVMLSASAYSASVKKGETVAFLGDSITQFGAHAQTGYVNLVDAGLKANGIDVKLVKAGISGHKSNQMLARLDRDVLKKKPNWMLLSCGVNDVWHGSRGVPLGQYKKNITEIVDKAQAAGVKVMILTATMIKEDADNSLNKQLAQYNVFLRKLANDKKCLIADLNDDMQKAVAKLKAEGYKGNILTRDGVHMNPFGDEMMATGILKSFGLTDAELAKAKAAWLKLPVVYELRFTRTRDRMPNITMTYEEACILQGRAKKAGKSYDQYLKEIIQKSLKGAVANELGK